MSKISLNKGKHLTIENRILIEYLLEERFSLKDIATISKEIKRNRFTKANKLRGNDLLRCESNKGCTKKNICKSNCTVFFKRVVA